MQKVSYSFKIATNEPYVDDLVTYLIKQMLVGLIHRSVTSVVMYIDMMLFVT